MATSRLKIFASQYHISGLTNETLNYLENGRYDMGKADAFLLFQSKVNQEFLSHPVICDNSYTKWFSGAELNDAQVKHFIIQFSVFFNQFLVAQLQKMINADTVTQMREIRGVLANELGVLFNDKSFKLSGHKKNSVSENENVRSLNSSIEGGHFHFKAGHFELILRMAENIGLDYRLLGKRKKGKSTTLSCCDEIVCLYGSEDYPTSMAAAYAFESWAAAGYSDQLLVGLNRYKTINQKSHFPLAFFSWHSQLEITQGRILQENLEAYYFNTDVDEEAFIAVGHKTLDAMATFWNGLNDERKKLH